MGGGPAEAAWAVGHVVRGASVLAWSAEVLSTRANALKHLVRLRPRLRVKVSGTGTGRGRGRVTVGAARPYGR